jgi:hypothetical protein
VVTRNVVTGNVVTNMVIHGVAIGFPIELPQKEYVVSNMAMCGDASGYLITYHKFIMWELCW